MNIKTYRALTVREVEPGTFSRNVEHRAISELPDHDLLVRVHYSSLNYKDALSATGDKGITRQYPHTPGIDAAGIVEESSDSRFSNGDEVIVTSYDLGENTPGGFGEYIRVPGDWTLPLPGGLSLRESMILGTAGLTAGIGAYKLQQNNTQPKDGPVLVTGATGGVGCLAISILATAGYQVTAATGKTEKENWLESLGAATVIHRDEVKDDSSKPLLSGRWAGVLDTVGGLMLDTAIRQTKQDGTVTCCGNILGHRLNTSVFPFILRGVSLMGIDSGHCGMDLRKVIWDRLAMEWKPAQLETIARETGLNDLDEEIKKILRGGQTGRIIVNLNIE